MELHSIIFLLSILSVIFLLTFYVHSKQKRKLNLTADKQEPRFDIVNQTFTAQNRPAATHYESDYNEDDDDEVYEDDLDEPKLLDDPLLQPKESVKQSSAAPSAKSQDTNGELLLIMLAARPDRPYAGYELLQSLLSCGLRFGAMDLFHRYEDLNGKGKILFSVASASETGTFEINKMGAYSGKGLMMFLRLGNQKDLVVSFDTMIETAKQLVEDLGGEILDEERKIVSDEKIELMRKNVIQFEQKRAIGDLFDAEKID